MATFTEWQPRYAERGIATFPVAVIGDRKKPLVSGYLKLGERVSQQLAMKFPDADGIGFAPGRRSRITVLDIDTSDERVLADALDRHGKTPIIVRSGGGKYHTWYRNEGERRKIRPFANLPIDILGGGYVVAPPSQGSQGRYEFIQGRLDDVVGLPALAGIDLQGSPHSTKISPRTDEGARNNSLWTFCMSQARACDDLDALLDVAMSKNEGFMPPLDQTEVVKIASSAWKYEIEGKNFIGGSAAVVVSQTIVDELAASDPYAFALFNILRRHHWSRRRFAVSKGMAAELNWTLDRLRQSRDRLIEGRLIRCVHPGGKGPRDPPIFTWEKGG